jgi:guanylate kinase
MVNDAPILFIVSGPSGSGKGTFLTHIAEQNRDLIRVQTFTTRPPRPNETAADYNFITEAEFHAKCDSGEIFESTRTYEDHYYGSPSRLIRADEPHDLMVELEVKGMLRLKSLSQRRVVSIFVMPPSLEALSERIKARHHEDNFEARLDKAKDQVSYAYAFDYILVNDDVDVFRQQAQTLVAAERNQRLMAGRLKSGMDYLLRT